MNRSHIVRIEAGESPLSIMNQGKHIMVYVGHKAASLFLAAVIALVAIAFADTARAVTLTAGNAQGIPGSTVVVAISMVAGTGEVVGGVNYRVTYDPAVLSFNQQTGYQDGPSATAAGKTGTVGTIGNDQVSVVVFGTISPSTAMANGVISNLTFTILTTATAPATSTLVLSNMAATTPSAGSLPVSGTDGTLTVNQTPPTFVGPVSPLVGEPSSNVILPVVLAVEPTVSVATLEFEVHFTSTELSYVSSSPGLAATNANKTVSVTLTSPGLLTVAVSASTTTAIAGGSLVEIQFNLPSTWLGGGETTIQVQNISASSTTAAPIGNLTTASTQVMVARSVIGISQTLIPRLNQTVSFPVDISTRTSFEVVSCQFDVEFDPNVFTYVDTIEGPSASNASKTVSAALQADGKTVRVVVIGSNTAAIPDGTIVNFSFTVKGTAPIGPTLIRLVNFKASNSSADSVDFTASLSKQFDVVAFEAEDINRDNIIDVVDVQLTVNLILNLATSAYVGQGDANGDTFVDVVDVQRIVNKILAP